MAKLALLGGPPVRATPLPYAHQTIEADDRAAVGDALGGDWITQGPTVARFERALAERAGVKHAVAVANGTAA
ncbi:MAG: DegT/DnrJ/EryC1/StrS family aminotransferase, partial [Candidatus Rokuibacteriota bacterium]